MGGAYTHAGLVPGSHTSENAARRGQTLDKVRELLAEGPLSNQELADQMGLAANTVYSYLRELRALGEVQQAPAVDSRGRKPWALIDEQEAFDWAVAQHAQRAWVVPARQIGMPRDPLVAALFGPAQAERKAA